MAIAADGPRQRYYVAPNEEHENTANVSRPKDVPDSEIPYNPRYTTAPNYGMINWSDLFTSRQLTMLTTIIDLLHEARQHILSDGADLEYADAISLYLAFSISKIADNSSSLCVWMYMPSKEGTAHTFARAAIPMVWDYAEGNPFRPGPCDYGESCFGLAEHLTDFLIRTSTRAAQIRQTLRRLATATFWL